MAESTRMKTFDENLKKMEILAQQYAAMLNLWRNSANLSFDEFQQKLEEQRLQLEDLEPIFEDSSGDSSGVEGTDERQSASLLFEPPVVHPVVVDGDTMELNRPSFLEEFKSENPSNPRLNPNPRAVNLDTNSITGSWTLEQEFLGTPPKEIHRGHNNSSYSMKQITSSSTPTTSKLGVCFNLDSELGREDREVLSPSIEKMISEFREGNSNYSEFDLIDLDGIELSSCVIDCEKWDYHGLDDNLGVGNLELQPTIVKDSVSFKEFKYMVNAHKVFVELSRLGVFQMEPTEISRVIESSLVLGVIVDKHRMVDRISVFDPGIDDRRGFISWEFTILVLVYIEVETAVNRRNWVFDPGKGLELSSHIERVETILVFDSVQKQHQLLVTLLLCNVAAMEALPIYMDKLFNQYLDILYFLNPAAGYNHPGHKFYVISYTGAVCC